MKQGMTTLIPTVKSDLINESSGSDSDHDTDSADESEDHLPPELLDCSDEELCFDSPLRAQLEPNDVVPYREPNPVFKKNDAALGAQPSLKTNEARGCILYKPPAEWCYLCDLAPCPLMRDCTDSIALDIILANYNFEKGSVHHYDELWKVRNHELNANGCMDPQVRLRNLVGEPPRQKRSKCAGKCHQQKWQKGKKNDSSKEVPRRR